MATLYQEQLVEFARLHGIHPSEAYVLPALFERSAQLANMTKEQLIDAALEDPAFGEYLAECAEKVANADRNQAMIEGYTGEIEA